MGVNQNTPPLHIVLFYAPIKCSLSIKNWTDIKKQVGYTNKIKTSRLWI